MIKYLSYIMLSLLLTTTTFAGTKSNIKVDGKLKSVFVMKTDKKLLGARVEILTDQGNLLTAQQLKNRKVIIDFTDVKLGTYTIRISKGIEVQEYSYTRK